VSEDGAYAWTTALRRAIRRNRRDAHNRYLQLATLRADGSPAVRTLVFRELDEGVAELHMVTDQRSGKVEAIAVDPRAEIAWYFTHTREQFRLRGTLRLTGPEASEPAAQDRRKAMWQALSEAAREQFFWPHPGQPVGSGEAPAPSAKVPDTFLVLTLAIAEVDHLTLRGDPQTRFQSRRGDDGAWVSKAINP